MWKGASFRMLPKWSSRYLTLSLSPPPYKPCHSPSLRDIPVLMILPPHGWYKFCTSQMTGTLDLGVLLTYHSYCFLSSSFFLSCVQCLWCTSIARFVYSHTLMPTWYSIQPSSTIPVGVFLQSLHEYLVLHHNDLNGATFHKERVSSTKAINLCCFLAKTLS